MAVDSGTENDAPQPAGIVERLVRDDADRKRFLKMAGSAGAASFGAFVLAACGSSKKKQHHRHERGRAGKYDDFFVERQHG